MNAAIVEKPVTIAADELRKIDAHVGTCNCLSLGALHAGENRFLREPAKVKTQRTCESSSSCSIFRAER